MIRLLVPLLLLAVAECRLDFSYSALFDMNDFKGTPNYPIRICETGCRVYLTYPDSNGLGDQYNGPFTIQINSVPLITFYDLNRLQGENGEKGYLTIPKGTTEFIVHNPNGNFAARPLALWVVPNTTPDLELLAVFEAIENLRIETSAQKVVLMGVDAFTATFQIKGQYMLYVQTSPFDMLYNEACEHVLYTESFIDDEAISAMMSLSFNSPLISFGFDFKAPDFNMTLTTDHSFPDVRSIDASGYLASPGYIGCSNATFRSESYNYGVTSFNETFLVEGETRRHVSFHGDLDTDPSAPVIVYDMDTDNAPMFYTGMYADHTNKRNFEMDTSAFSIHWDSLHWKNESFMIRYEVDTSQIAPTLAPKTTPLVVKTTTTVQPAVAQVDALPTTLPPGPSTSSTLGPLGPGPTTLRPFGSTGQTWPTTLRPPGSTTLPGPTTLRPLGSTTLPGPTTLRPLGSTTLPGPTTLRPLGSTTLPGPTTLRPPGSTTLPGPTTLRPSGSTNIAVKTTNIIPKTTTTIQAAVAQDNYCKCGLADDGSWFEGFEPSDIWVDVIIILDTSKSMGASLEEAKSVITSFVGLMSTDTNAEFFSRIGVIAVSDTVQVVYNLNMTNSDDLDNVQQHQIDKIDVGAAFQAALKMFADGTKVPSFREKAKQIIYYLTNSAPGANMNGVDDFKTGGGIIIVNDFILEGEVADPGLQKLASDNFFFTALSENYMNSLVIFCEANCFCTPAAHPYNDDDNSPRTQANLGCYHPVNNGIPQSKARQTCQKEAGSLVSIHDKDKEFFVNGVVSIFGPKKKFWIGYENDGYQWHWDDNSTNPFTDWDVVNGQPNTNGGKNLCAYAQQGTGFNTPWTAANCAMGGVIYVCESRPCSVGYDNCT